MIDRQIYSVAASSLLILWAACKLAIASASKSEEHSGNKVEPAPRFADTAGSVWLILLAAGLASLYLLPALGLPACILVGANFKRWKRNGFQKKRKREEHRYRSGLSRMAGMIEAGLSLESAVTRLGADSALWRQIGLHLDTGVSFASAVQTTSSAPESLRNWAEIMPILQQSGARIAPLLHRFASMEERREQMLERQYALAAQGRLQARVLSLLPVLLVPLLIGMDARMAQFYLHSFVGALLLAVAALFVVAANAWMEKRLGA